MQLKKGETELKLPVGVYNIVSVVVVVDGVGLRMPMAHPAYLEKKAQEMKDGHPAFFAHSVDKLLFAPKADTDYEIKVRYTTLHEL